MHEIEVAPLPPRRSVAPWRENVSGVVKAGGKDPSRWRVTTESELPDGWRIVGHWRYRDGRVRLEQPVELVPPPNGDDDTLTGLKAMVRRLGMGWVGAEWESVFRSRVVELPDEWVEGFRASPRPGRAGHPIGWYAQWVDRYLRAVGEFGEPMAALIQKHPGETKDSINRYIRAAERRGLITDRPGRGRAGGTMTDLCRRVLAGEEA